MAAVPTERSPQADAEEVVRLAQALEPLRGAEGEGEGEPWEEPLDEALVRTVALSSAGVLSPMAAMLGSVAAQEVLKVGAGPGRGSWEGRRSHCESQRVPHARQWPWRFTARCSPPPGFEGFDGGKHPDVRPPGSLQEVPAPGPVAVF